MIRKQHVAVILNVTETGPIMLIVGWIAFMILTAIAAKARGRSFFLWLIIGCFTGVFGLIAVLVMKDHSRIGSA